MSTTVINPSKEVAAYLGTARAVSAVNRIVACSNEYIREIDVLLESNPHGLNPQEAADGFLVNAPNTPIFAHLGAMLKALAILSVVPVDGHPKREWLYAADTGRTIATRVPWSTTPLAQGGVYATELEALAAAQAMLAACPDPLPEF